MPFYTFIDYIIICLLSFTTGMSHPPSGMYVLALTTAPCGLYHSIFDFAEDLGWVFYPTNVKYFIRFKCEDRLRTLTVPGTG